MSLGTFIITRLIAFGGSSEWSWAKSKEKLFCLNTFSAASAECSTTAASVDCSTTAASAGRSVYRNFLLSYLDQIAEYQEDHFRTQCTSDTRSQRVHMKPEEYFLISVPVCTSVSRRAFPYPKHRVRNPLTSSIMVNGEVCEPRRVSPYPEENFRIQRSVSESARVFPFQKGISGEWNLVLFL